MRRFVLPTLAVLALAVGAGSAKAQLIVSSGYPYSGYYSSGYLAVSPSVVVTPSMGYYGSYYPAYTYGSYYTTPYVYGSYYPSYSSSYYYPSSMYSGSYYYPSYYGRYYDGWLRRGWRWR